MKDMTMTASQAKVLHQDFIANAPDDAKLDWQELDGRIEWMTTDLKELKRSMRRLHSDLGGRNVGGGWLDHPVGEVIRSLKESKPQGLKSSGKRLVRLG